MKGTKKRLLSMALAACMTLGTAAAFNKANALEPNVNQGNGFRYSIKDDGTVSVFYFTMRAEIISIPEKVDGKPVTSVGSFGSTSEAKRICLPSSIKTIEDGAFQGIENLSEIVMNNGLESIGRDAFDNCSSLKSIKIPASVRNIHSYAFHYSSIENINVDKNNKTYSSIDGMLYTKDGSKLLACPGGKKEAVVTQGTKEIAASAFDLGTQRVILPHGLQKTSGMKGLDYYAAFVVPSTVKEDTYNMSMYGYCDTFGEVVKPYNNVFCYKGSPAAKEADKRGYKYIPVDRLNGSNRYMTAAVISQNLDTNSDTVILASGEGYADALAGVPLASYKNAPILLTPKNTLSKDTLAEIDRRKTKEVIILGGEGAVSKNVELELSKRGIKTKRFAGKTRYGTALSIAQNITSTPQEIFCTYANDFADALSASSVAAAKNAPIIYLSKNGDPDKDTAAYLKNIKGSVKKAYVIGGSGVISDNIMKKASALLGLKMHETVERIWGQNRYETCIAINERFSSLLTGRSIYVSTGKNYPDALAGGVLAAHNRSAMLLCDVRLSNSQTNMLKKMHGYTLTAFGGFGAVSDELFQRVCLATAEPPRTNLY